MHTWPTSLSCTITILLTSIGFSSTIFAADEPIPDELLLSFEQLTLIGQFTIDRPGEEAAPLKPERYEIVRVVRAKTGQFVVQARIKYGKNDVTVPVPVDLYPAGRMSVVCSLDDLKIPLLGEGFSSRVVFDFDSNRYAGTWKHGSVGGHMWGVLQPASAVIGEDDVLVLPKAEIGITPRE